jgi:hypothetical protein
MTRRPEEPVPALQNEDVTGMTEDQQKSVIERSGRAPRKDAAEEFLEEQNQQAQRTPAPTRDTER